MARHWAIAMTLIQTAKLNGAQKTAGTAPEDLLVTAVAASSGRSARTAAWTTTDPHIDGQVDQCRCHNAPGTGAVCRPPQAA
jgi:hypothetical protein